MPELVDTSALLALADVASEQHGPVRAHISTTHEALLVPVTVLPEADYLITQRFGLRAELILLRSISADGQFHLETLTAADLRRSVELIEQYADSNIGLVDASIVAIAERLRIRRILTLDYRHFHMFRPRHCEAFELIP